MSLFFTNKPSFKSKQEQHLVKLVPCSRKSSMLLMSMSNPLKWDCTKLKGAIFKVLIIKLE